MLIKAASTCIVLVALSVLQVSRAISSFRARVLVYWLMNKPSHRTRVTEQPLVGLCPPTLPGPSGVLKT